MRVEDFKLRCVTRIVDSQIRADIASKTYG